MLEQLADGGLAEVGSAGDLARSRQAIVACRELREHHGSVVCELAHSQHGGESFSAFR
jgi:hypothetical protein